MKRILAGLFLLVLAFLIALPFLTHGQEKKRDAVPIDQAFWREEALRVLGTLFRGATAFPPGRGVWRDDERGGALVFDDTVLVTSYAAEQDCHEAAWRQLRAFLHRMGRDARQGEIGLVLDGKYLGIDRYDPEP